MHKFTEDEAKLINELFEKSRTANYIANIYRWGFAIGLVVGCLASWFISYMGWV